MNSKLVLFGFVGSIQIVTVTHVSGTLGLKVYASSNSDFEEPSVGHSESRVPTIITGDNVHIVWFTNVGTVNSNYEAGFRVSTDNGQTFGPITTISKTDNYDSINAEISAKDQNIIFSYWEQNETSFLPYAKVSIDGRLTFGEKLNITDNAFGTISSEEE